MSLNTGEPRSISVSRRQAVTGGVALTLAAACGTPARAQSALQSVVSAKKITIGMQNAAPWAFVDANSKVSGFSPDLVRAAFAPLGVTDLDFLISDWGALIPGLSAGRFDAIASGLYITPVRCKAVLFSDPDLSLKDAVLVKAGNPAGIHSYKDFVGNPKLRLAVGRGSTTFEGAKSAGIPLDRIQQFQDVQSLVAALVTGRVDASALSVPTVLGLLADPKLKDIERAAPFQGYVQSDGVEKSGYSAIAFRLDAGDLRDAYNKRLAEMKADGTVAKIMAKYGFTDEDAAPALTSTDICNGKG